MTFYITVNSNSFYRRHLLTGTRNPLQRTSFNHVGNIFFFFSLVCTLFSAVMAMFF